MILRLLIVNDSETHKTTLTQKVNKGSPLTLILVKNWFLHSNYANISTRFEKYLWGDIYTGRLMSPVLSYLGS